MQVTDEMVNRFLGWKLPEDFAPDCGITFKPMRNEHMERFAAEVQAPLLARIRELTLYVASVEAELESAREEARQNFVRAREWAERCGAAESQRNEALEDAVRAYGKSARMAGVHSVQEQTAVIVRAALELLESIEGETPFTAEKMRAFKRVFGA